MTDNYQDQPAASFESCAPCRLCLFGEHQDYLHLPVIAMSLPIFCRIRVEPRIGRVISLKIPTLHKTMSFDLDNLPPRQQPGTPQPDFALAAIHEALQDGWTFPYGAACVSTIDKELPMQAGCSTSSAFCVAWIQALACLAGRQLLSPLQLAQRAHQAEVAHFHAPGGTMDHITSAVGGFLRIGPDPWQFTKLPALQKQSRGVWVLAYSGEPKDTLGHLWRCKDARMAILQKLNNEWDSSESLSNDEVELLDATRINRDTEALAFQKWRTAAVQNEKESDRSLGHELGRLMTEHHNALRDGLRLSTPKLEAINKAAVSAGAWGFKVVGSGGGGCGVAWSPEEVSSSVTDAMRTAGAALVWTIRSPSVGAHILWERRG